MTKRADLKYTVKYYKDSVSDGNHIALADREYPNAVYNTPLSALTVEKTLASDLVPLGYQATGTIDTAHSLDKIGINDNIICVVLPRRKDIPYTINYYKDVSEKRRDPKAYSGRDPGLYTDHLLG